MSSAADLSAAEEVPAPVSATAHVSFAIPSLTLPLEDSPAHRVG